MQNLPMFTMAHVGAIALLPLELGTTAIIKDKNSEIHDNTTQWKIYLDEMALLKLLLPASQMVFIEFMKRQSQDVFGNILEVYSSIILGQLSISLHIFANYITHHPRHLSIACITSNLIIIIAAVITSRPFLLIIGLIDVVVLVCKLGFAFRGSALFLASLVLLAVIVTCCGIHFA
jgi:hypothetical protein